MAMKFRSNSFINRFGQNGNIRYAKLQEKYSDESDVDNNDDNNDTIQLQTKKKETPTLDVEIEFDDTLQAIALKYHCTIAELKRINNIYSENEIFARRIIRVPVRPHSIISELIVGVHVSGNTSPLIPTAQLINIDTDQLEEKLSKTSSPEHNSSDLNTHINNLIYNSKLNNDLLTTQTDATSSTKNVIEYLPNSEQVDGLISKTNQTIVLAKRPTLIQEIFTSGDDCGFSWLALVVLVVILGFICPLIYIFYIAEHPEKFHHHN